MSQPVALIFRHQPIEPTRMGFILAMFFWAYGIMQVPAGRLVDKFGIRKLYTVTFLVWGLVATVFGLVTSVWMFIALRGALGVLESVPATRFTTSWRKEVSRIYSEMNCRWKMPKQ